MFEKAKSIWLKNKRTTKNLQVGFRCDFDADENKTYILKITGATFYRIFLNGEFSGYGPARAGHGYLRVDEIPLKVSRGKNKLAIEVAGYNCSSFYTLPIKSFLCAEVIENDKAIKYTGKDFSALSLEKLRNIYAYRYSYQRAYTEVWNFDNSDSLTWWHISDSLIYEKVFEFDVCEKFIPRNLPLPEYNIKSAYDIAENGHIIHKNYEFEELRYITNVSNNIDGYLQSEITEKTVSELYGDFIPSDTVLHGRKDIHIGKDEYVIFKLNCNSTGFLINNIKVHSDSKIFVFFSEYNYGNGMIFDSFEGQINIVKYNLKANKKEYRLETFEPYTCQYLGIAVTDGEISVSIPKLREYCYPKSHNVIFKTKNETLFKIFEASRETFRQNTLDIYMDCPSRERGGWLCDSYFTAWSEKFFAGDSRVEKVFLDNFVMAEEFPNLPQGMLPMVYPSDVKKYGGGYIPQWAMWYVVELGEYCKARTGADAQKYKKLCYELLAWFENYENSDGLLEKMPGWNFVEWSKANDWVQDVNYPTNMLYTKMLSTMGEIFADKSLVKKANTLTKKIIQQSFDGQYFVDNAIRENDGNLKLTANRSETCQYYAYFFGIADTKDKRFEKLTHTIINVFGPDRKKNGAMKQIAFSNAFIGNYLRIIILLRLKQFEKAISDIMGYFGKMAELTGTLWEYDDLNKAKTCGSLNHGFSSFAGVALIYAQAGISYIDYVSRRIYVDEKFLSNINYDLEINTAEGKICISENNGKKTLNIPPEWNLSKGEEE